MNKIFLILLAAWSAVTPLAGAQQPRELSLDEALRMAEQNSPQLLAAQSSVEGARAGIVTAKTYQNPTLSFGTMGRQQPVHEAGLPGMLHGLTLSQPLETRGVRSTRLEAARHRREGTEASVAEVRLAVRGAVKRAFFDVLRRRGELELAQGNVDLIEDLRRRIAVQVKVGEAARLELTRAEAEVASARIQVRSAELRLTGAMASLQSAMGVDLENVALRAKLDPPQKLPPLENIRAEVLSSHPSLAVADAEVRRSGALVANERAQRVPQPTAWLDYLHQPDTAQIRVGVTIPLPMWDRRRGPIAEAVAQQHYAAAVAQQRKIEITAALERAYNQYQVATQQVAIFEADTLRQAEAAVKAAQAAFQFGERGIIEVLDAQRVLRAARMDFLNAEFDRQQALIDLEQLRAVDLGGNKP